ncbi:hypothetical protein [Agromyces bauzanensis]
MTTLTEALSDQFVDPEPVRAHILALEAGGMSPEAISALASCHEMTIRRIATGAGVGALSTPVHRQTAERILLIPIELTAMQTASQRPSRGARRRIQALGAMGWSITLLAWALKVPEHSLEAVLSAPLISIRKDDAIREVFRQLWDKPAPERTAEEQLLKICALARAEAEGWLSPLAWDDIDNDDRPAETPRPDPNLIDDVAVHLAITGDRIKLNRLELDRAIKLLRDEGCSSTEIAARLRISVSTAWRKAEGEEESAAAA